MLVEILANEFTKSNRFGLFVFHPYQYDVMTNLSAPNSSVEAILHAVIPYIMLGFILAKLIYAMTRDVKQTFLFRMKLVMKIGIEA